VVVEEKKMLSIVREWQWVREFEKWLRAPIPTVIARHAGEDIAKCEHCHKLLKVHYFNRLIVHLRIDHDLSETAAIETTTWIMDRVLRTRTAATRLANAKGKL
jgi:hypothetical protein